MADVDIDLFEDHSKTEAQPDETGGTIPLIQGGVGGGASWEPKREQETSFGGKTQRTRLKEAQVEGLYQKLSEIAHQTARSIPFRLFRTKRSETVLQRQEYTLNPSCTNGGGVGMTPQWFFKHNSA